MLFLLLRRLHSFVDWLLLLLLLLLKFAERPEKVCRIQFEISYSIHEPFGRSFPQLGLPVDLLVVVVFSSLRPPPTHKCGMSLAGK